MVEFSPADGEATAQLPLDPAMVLAAQLQERVQQQEILASAIIRIRDSLDLTTLFNTTSREVRQLLKADRVGVFRFDPNRHWDDGEFVAEDVIDDFPSAIATKVHDHCFGNQFAVHYAQGRVQAVADIYSAGLSPCHIDILAAFHVRANLIVPLLSENHLWGLLCIHQCHAPRHWQPSEIAFVQQIAHHFGVALQQAAYIEQIQAVQCARMAEQTKALNRQKSLFKITHNIRKSLEFSVICQTAVAEVRCLLAANRVTIHRFTTDGDSELLFESCVEDLQSLMDVSSPIQAIDWMAMQQEYGTDHKTIAVDNIYHVKHLDQHVQRLAQYQIQAYVTALIFQEDQLWGLLTAFHNTIPRTWQEDEIQLLAQVSEQLGIAIQQAEYVQQLQTQAVELNCTLKDLKRSEMQLIQQEKMISLGQLVAGMAHEINNPINVIYGNLNHVERYSYDLLQLLTAYQHYYPNPPELLRADLHNADLPFLQEDLAKLLESMKLGSQRIRDLVLSLRNFSRLDEADCKFVNLHEGIDNALVFLQYRIQGNMTRPDIEIVKQYGELPLVECYARHFNQVMINLLTNAIDALEERSRSQSCRDMAAHPYRIAITTTQTAADWIAVTIADTGTGIPERMRSRLFDPFFTSKPVGQGAGLGLSISYQIITEKHSGKFSCDSTWGEGTKFVIELPLAAKAGPTQAHHFL